MAIRIKDSAGKAVFVAGAGKPGATFQPAVSEDGTLNWTNDGGMENPAPVNIRGPKGADGAPGKDGAPGAQGIQGLPGKDGAAGAAGRDATINGVNALELKTDEHLNASQAGNVLTIGLKSVPQTSATQIVTLTTAGWAKNGNRYQQQVSVSGVTADTPVVLVDCALTGTDLDADAAVLEAWKGPSANNVTQGAGTLTFYSYAVPAVNIPVNVGVA